MPGYQILEKCRAIEITISELYLSLAERFSESIELSRLFGRLGGDELDHAMQLKLGQNLAREGIFKEAKMTLVQVEQLQRQVEATRDKLTQQALTAEVALRYAIRIEEIFTRVHLLAVGTLTDPQIKGMFDRLARSEQAHLDDLTEFYKNFRRPAAP